MLAVSRSAGIAFGNWRHALVAVLGAFIANVLAAQAGALGGAINFGFIGFNGVLAALAAYVIVAADLRLVVLGSVLATGWPATFTAVPPFRCSPPGSSSRSGRCSCSAG